MQKLNIAEFFYSVSDFSNHQDFGTTVSILISAAVCFQPKTHNLSKSKSFSANSRA